MSALGEIVAGSTGDGVRFTVLGHPVTQGGTQTFATPQGRRHVTTGGKGLAGWRQEIALAAARAGEHVGITFGDAAVEVLIEFRFPMRSTARKSERNVGLAFHAGRKDDLDKLVRAILDGLTASGLIADDGLVVDLHATKREHTAGWTGADVTVRPARLFSGAPA